MAQNPGINQIPVALMDYLDICAADSTGLDLQQGPAFWRCGIGDALQLQPAGG
jgi:hypothetical protein